MSNGGEGQLLVGDGCNEHVLDVIELGLAVTVGLKNAIVDDPVLCSFRVDVETVEHADAFYDGMSIAAVLTPHQFDFVGEVLVQDRVVEHEETARRWDDLGAYIFPDQPRGQLVAAKIAVDRIMTEVDVMTGMMCQREVHLTRQQKLAVINACWLHAEDSGEPYATMLFQ